jgi:hypothetical protein
LRRRRQLIVDKRVIGGALVYAALIIATWRV